MLQEANSTSDVSKGPSLRLAVWTAIFALISIVVSSIALQAGTFTLDIYIYVIIVPILVIIVTVPILQIYLFRVIHRDLSPDVEWANVENSFRTTLATIIGGGAILSTVVFGWYNISNTKQSTTAERFARAIEFLAKQTADGDGKAMSDAVPLLHVAGLYAIQEIANDDIAYREKSLNLIRSFIANLSGRHKNEFCRQLMISGRSIINPTGGQSPGDNIQTALDILGKGFPAYLSGEQPVVDLSRMDLCFAYLPNANLPRLFGEGSDFRRSRFEGSNLRNATIRGADFTLANLSGVDFRGSDLRCSIFTNSSVSESRFDGADLNCADLTGVNMSLAKGLENAKLDGACLDSEPALPSQLKIITADCKWRAQNQDIFDNDRQECEIKCRSARGEP